MVRMMLESKLFAAYESQGKCFKYCYEVFRGYCCCRSCCCWCFLLLLLLSNYRIATMQSVVTGQTPITLKWKNISRKNKTKQSTHYNGSTVHLKRRKIEGWNHYYYCTGYHLLGDWWNWWSLSWMAKEWGDVLSFVPADCFPFPSSILPPSLRDKRENSRRNQR